MAINGSATGLKGRTFELWTLSRRIIIFCVRRALLRGGGGREREKGRETIIIIIIIIKINKCGRKARMS